MEIRLSPELAAAVERGVASGRYASAEEFVGVAIELLDEPWVEETVDEQLEKMEASIQEAERGELTSIHDVRHEMEEMKKEWLASH